MVKQIKLYKILGIISIIFLAVFLFYFFVGDPVALSESQEEIIKNLGRPDQFSITYLPKGSDKGSEFIRQEEWFYPKLETQLTFLAGELVKTDELKISEGAEYRPTNYNSENFNFYTDLDLANKLMGEHPLEPLDLPGFFDEGVEVYGGAGAMFVFENGYMTYMETLD